MDCKTARLLLEFARPCQAELPAEDADALDAHLTSCGDCDALARAERAGDARIGQAMRDVPVPAGLRSAILAKLSADRGGPQIRRAGWTLRIAAAAAVLFLIACLGYVWYGNRARPLDLWELH